MQKCRNEKNDDDDGDDGDDDDDDDEITRNVLFILARPRIMQGRVLSAYFRVNHEKYTRLIIYA